MKYLLALLLLSSSAFGRMTLEERIIEQIKLSIMRSSQEVVNTKSNMRFAKNTLSYIKRKLASAKKEDKKWWERQAKEYEDQIAYCVSMIKSSSKFILEDKERIKKLKTKK